MALNSPFARVAAAPWCRSLLTVTVVVDDDDDDDDDDDAHADEGDDLLDV